MTLTRSPMKPGKPLARTVMARTKAPGKRAVAKKSQKGKATVAEREHMGRVAALGCCLCAFLNYGHQLAEVHHVRVRHGWGRSGHMNTIPLCALHHTGQPGGVHDFGREQFTLHYGISEIALLERINEQLGVV